MTPQEEAANYRFQLLATQRRELRDWFAGQALASTSHMDNIPLELAVWCYGVADAMLAEREKAS